MRRTQLVAALFVCAVIGLPRGVSAQAAPPATGLAGIAAPQPLDSIVTLTGFEDTGWPYTTALGYQAAANTTGNSNTALGYQALTADTTGYENTASGIVALYSNTTGIRNTASGAGALFYNTGGQSNTANGWYALFSNTMGYLNTASGELALYSNTTGNSNTASGGEALYANTGGQYNTANGFQALYANTGGQYNTASGYRALFANTQGQYNTALGIDAGFYATTGNYNLFLGAGVLGTPTDTNTIRIGLPYNGTNGQNQTFIAGIYGTPVTGGLPVVIDANGQLGTINPQTGGGIPAPLSTVIQLQQQVRDQQTTITDLRDRLTRLEVLVGASARGTDRDR